MAKIFSCTFFFNFIMRSLLFHILLASLPTFLSFLRTIMYFQNVDDQVFLSTGEGGLAAL